MSFWLLLLFIVLEWPRPTVFVPGLYALHPNTVTLYTAFAMSVFGASAISNKEIFTVRNTRLMLVLLGILVLSMLTSDSHLLAWYITRTVLENLLLYWVIAKQITTVPRLKRFIWVLVLSNIAVGVLTPGLLTSSERTGGTASGNFLGDGNDYALSCNIAIALCLFLVFEAKVLTRLIAAAALLWLVFTVMMTQSRGGTLGLMAIGLYFWLKSDRKIVTGLLAAAAIVVVVQLAPSTYWERMNNIVNTQEGSAAGRIAAWDGGWRMALDHPVLGVGAGRFAFEYGYRYRKSLDIPWQTAHSIYFQILGELGFPGIAILITIIASLLAQNRRLAREVRARDDPAATTEYRMLASVSAGVVAYAVTGAFLSADYHPHLYMLAGLATAAHRLIRERLAGDAASAPKPSTPALTVHWALRPTGTTGSRIA